MGFFSEMQREIERQRAAQLREQRRIQRESERAQREAERQAARDEKEQKRLYVEDRVQEVERLNIELEDTIGALETILQATLSVDDHIDLETLKEPNEALPFEPGSLATPEPEPLAQVPDSPRGLGALVPGARLRHEAAVQAGQSAHLQAAAEWRERESAREQELAAAREQHDREAAERQQVIQKQHAEIDNFRAGLEDGKPEAVADYFGLVLEASRYPDNFPKSHKLAFVPESKQLVIEQDLPSFDVVPELKLHKYVKARDEITTTARPVTQRKALYASVVAQTGLRTVHELFEADRNNLVETIVYNGMIDGIDKRTGQAARTCVLTLRTTRDTFEALELGRVDPQECLKGLNAGVSKQPSELAPVRPVLTFEMVDARFTDESEVLSDLDQRPNLMELTPSEFESLITNLFGHMGLETRQTRPSRDGGVDCVAWDTRPIMGGKVVIQAKRYKNTVGVAAVRDLFGTVHNEGAGKGILVTTSGYGKASFEFAQGKPLELIDGSNLLYLLRENAEVEACIEPPEDWTDPDGAVLS